VSEGNEVYRLVRVNTTTHNEVEWNINTGIIDQEKLEKILPDVVIHLAGESVLSITGWNATKKKNITM
jgi:uncharacterized protein